MTETQKQILYIEDHPDSRRFLSLALGQNDYEVTTADSIAAARRCLAEAKFDCVIIDRWLPDGDGADLCRALREEGETVPVIIISGSVYPRDLEIAQQAGCSSFVAKPVEIFEMLREIQKHLSSASPNDSGTA